VSIRAIGWAFDQVGLSPSNKLVLVALADNANDEGICWPGWEAVASKTGLSRASIYRCYRQLEEAGFLSEKTIKNNRLVKVLAVSQRDDSSQGETAKSHSETPLMEEPSVEPSGTKTPTPSSAAAVGSSKTEEVDGVWATYVETMKPRGRGRQLAADDRDVIRLALKVGDADELKSAIAACEQSDFHMKRGSFADRQGGKHNSIPKIFKPRRGKPETWRSRLEWWLDLFAEQLVGGDAEFDVNAEMERMRKAQGL
jgi:hypothetical protein